MKDPWRMRAEGLLYFTVFVVGGTILISWLRCQQLAPVERLFTRGC